MKSPFVLLASLFLVTATIGCTNSETQQGAEGSTPPAAASSGKDLGIGPVKSVVLEAEIKDALAKQGQTLFEAKCSACHKTDERYVGPALKGVTERREPEWIMNMILNPQEMVQKNDIAKELLGEYLVPMTFQNLTQDEARAVLEYFRKIDKK